MKVLHTADLHIGAEQSFLGQEAQNRQYEILAVFKSITLLCQKESVEVCLISGDLFDSNFSARVFAESVFRYISEASNTKFFYVAGNHDPLDASSPFVLGKLPENLTVFGSEYETVVVDELGLRITGRSFSHSSMDFKDMPPMPDDDKVNILLMHSDFGAVGSVYNPISSSFVKDCSADYLALGHIHKRTETQKIGKTYMAYPGCPEGQGFDEAGVKGVYLGEITKTGVNLDFIPCSSRIHAIKKIDLSDAENTDQAVKTIHTLLEEEFGERYKQNLYKLILTGNCENPKNINTAEIASVLNSQIYFVKVKNQVKQKLDLELLSQEISLRGIFVNKMLSKIKEAPKEEQKRLIDAMYLGLDAFLGEVEYDED